MIQILRRNADAAELDQDRVEIDGGAADAPFGGIVAVVAFQHRPDDIAQKLTASLHKALGDDTFRASLEKVGFLPLRPKSQAEIDKFIATDRARWAGVIKALNISLD